MIPIKYITALIILIGLLSITGCGQSENEFRLYDDPCGVIFAGSSEDYPDKLQEASVGSDFLNQFPPESLSCSSTTKDGISRRRSIYITFEDDHGTVVVAAVLHEKEEVSKWKTNLNRTLSGLDLVYDKIVLEEGHFLLGWSSNHPRVEEAQSLHAESANTISLADIVSRLSDEKNEH